MLEKMKKLLFLLLLELHCFSFLRGESGREVFWALFWRSELVDSEIRNIPSVISIGAYIVASFPFFCTGWKQHITYVRVYARSSSSGVRRSKVSIRSTTTRSTSARSFAVPTTFFLAYPFFSFLSFFFVFDSYCICQAMSHAH